MFEKIKNWLFRKKDLGAPATEKEFKKMSKPEKKELLSNDLSERMIRVEQNVSAQFGQPVQYKKTEYYKSMTPSQRESFEKYLKNKGKKKVLSVFIFLLPLIIIGFLNFSITGKVVNEEISNKGFNLIFIFIGIFLIVAFLFLAISHKKRKRAKKFNRHAGVLDKSLCS